MKKENFTPAIAQSFLNAQGINESDVLPVFATISGNSFSSFVAVTEIPVSAANKKAGISIKKVSTVNAAVYSGLKPETNPYLNKLAKAGTLEHELKENWFFHYSGIFSLVAKRSNPDDKYLYALPDSGHSHYFINGELSTKDEVLGYLTPSEQKKLTEKSELVCCRVYKLDNIKQINIEHTDTFGNDANYSWVKRDNITLKDNASRLAIVRAAKKYCGFNGIKAEVSDFGDMIRIKPRGYNQICFVTFDYD